MTCVNDAPVADDETFNGADAASATRRSWATTRRRGADRTGPHKTITGDILAGDTDIDGPGR